MSTHETALNDVNVNENESENENTPLNVSVA